MEPNCPQWANNRQIFSKVTPTGLGQRRRDTAEFNVKCNNFYEISWHLKLSNINGINKRSDFLLHYNVCAEFNATSRILYLGSRVTCVKCKETGESLRIPEFAVIACLYNRIPKFIRCVCGCICNALRGPVRFRKAFIWHENIPGYRLINWPIEVWELRMWPGCGKAEMLD